MEIGEDIARVLSKVCPAFYRTKGCGSAIWHNCYCKAKTSVDDDLSMEHCDCVWHRTSSCLAGCWSQLSFIDDANELSKEKSAIWLSKAKEVAEKS